MSERSLLDVLCREADSVDYKEAYVAIAALIDLLDDCDLDAHHLLRFALSKTRASMVYHILFTSRSANDPRFFLVEETVATLAAQGFLESPVRGLVGWSELPNGWTVVVKHLELEQYQEWQKLLEKQ